MNLTFYNCVLVLRNTRLTPIINAAQIHPAVHVDFVHPVVVPVGLMETEPLTPDHLATIVANVKTTQSDGLALIGAFFPKLGMSWWMPDVGMLAMGNRMIMRDRLEEEYEKRVVEDLPHVKNPLL